MTRLLITLDYELFFGPSSGSVERCLIDPTNALAEMAERHGARLTLFVDSGFLRASRDHTDPSVRASRDLVRRQLSELSARGHDVQLHIHPHWEDSRWNGEGWAFDMARYRLHEFAPEERRSIVAAYKAELEDVVRAPVFAYRAGGWCLQPFAELAESLRASGIWLDSTVFDGGVSDDPDRHFDYRNAPREAVWRFSSDPLVEDADGYFVEVPISSMALSPLAYWLMALLPRLSRKNRSLGDGAGMKWSKKYYLTRLLLPSTSPASIDGVKARFTRRAFARRRRAARDGVVNVMGHPKAVSRSSIEQLGQFLAEAGLAPATLQDFAEYAPT